MSKIYNFGCGPKNSVTKQPVKIVKTLQERDNIPCKLRTEGLIVIVTENNYEEYQLRPTSENPICSNNAWVILDSNLGGLDVDKSYRADKRILYLGGQSPNVYENYFNLKDALVAGNNIFTSLNGVPDGGPLDIFSRGYVGVGFDIFKDFTGDTDYRPSHPAHDSLVGYGRAIGTNIKDGTNLTMMGTTVFHRNDRPLMDNVHAFGKGVTNGLSFPDVPRRTNATSNNWSFSNMVTDVNVFGAEMWCGDIHSSTIVGSNVRMYSYIFASVVLGNHNMNLNNFYYPGETGLVDYLDHDIIIGNGIFKDPKKYPATHNLLIGSQDSFGSGGAPNLNYKPLIEGNFKNPYLTVNGDFNIKGTQKIYQTSPEQEKARGTKIPLSVLGVPAGGEGTVTFNQNTNTISFNNAPAGIYTFASGLQNGTYNLNLYPSGMTNTFWVRILDLYDDSITFNYVNRILPATTGGLKDFKIELTAPTTATIYTTFDKLDETDIKPTLSVYNTQGQNVMDVVAADQFITIGKQVMPKKYASINSIGIGGNIMKDILTFNNVLNIGYNIGPNIKATNNSVMIGNNIGNQVISEVKDNLRNITVVGQNVGNKLKNGLNFTLVGFNVLSSFVGSDTSGNKAITAIGASAGISLLDGESSILIGHVSGYGATNIKDSVVIRPTGNENYPQFNTSNVENSISISGKPNTPAIGSNTTSIGNPQTEQTILYGKINLKERLKVKSYSKAERNALPNKEVGDLIYQTDAGNSGLRFFDGVNWLAIPTVID